MWGAFPFIVQGGAPIYSDLALCLCTVGALPRDIVQREEDQVDVLDGGAGGHQERDAAEHRTGWLRWPVLLDVPAN